ncbi:MULTISPECIES: ATP-grasp fold amidoligase family protein [unclassified Acinetobacter]|uniref:ATP-grasp fold amidoligase family protein n=1 Tax=unclassified Acinetobacter TaxID=196816 RepID=UPI002934EC8D|nr:MULTISPECIES: ATP-grasp fold amidoligase family protein [unclassified Acinetobacter]WOE31271.1 ATP-grasp fold amidoligase family protein [Acinetobacter sp. SAAs470]WOE39467.1 ATP-grasp fold amidoligase family protein [Acinetobacter sp. SAAs474]
MIKTLIYKAKCIRMLFVSDEKYLKKRFIKKLGYIPDFKQPKTFNEKVTARMIFDRSTVYTTLADKYAVREFIVNKIGEQYLVPLIGVYRNFNEIDFMQLPQRFVLKCTHDSGSAIICKNKQHFDWSVAIKKTNANLQQNMYYRKREWHYKDILPQILIEDYVELYRDPTTQSIITTCRVHCFEGQAKYVEVDVYAADGVEYSNIYDESWSLQPFTVDLKQNTPISIAQPSQFKKMWQLAEKLCFLDGYSRIDFLLSTDHVFFSEITLTPNTGRMVISPPEWDHKLGQFWHSF